MKVKKQIRMMYLQRSGSHGTINWILSMHDSPRVFIQALSDSPDVPSSDDPIAFYQTDYYNIKKKRKGRKLNCQTDSRDGVLSEDSTILYSYECKPMDSSYPYGTRQNDAYSPFKTFSQMEDLYNLRADESLNVLLIRNPYDMMASRHKDDVNKKRIKGWGCLVDTNNQWGKHYTTVWKQYAREFLGKTNFLEDRKVFIQFDKWHEDENYRRSLADKLGVEFNDKYKDIVPTDKYIAGSGSSFSPKRKQVDKKGVVNRWKYWQDNPNEWNIIRENYIDDDFIKLSNEIFGEVEGMRQLLYD